MTETLTLRRRRTAGRVALLALVTAFAVLPACSSGSDPELVFRYDLATIGGEDLPHVLSSTMADRIHVTAALLVLEPDGSYSMTMLLEITNAGEVTQPSTGEIGAWTQSGSQLTLVSSFQSETTLGTLNGPSLTIPSFDITLFFGDDDSEDFVLNTLGWIERQGQSH